MLESLIKAKGEESPESLAAAELISRLKVCGEIRNKYAHGLWSQVLLDGKNCVRLTNWLPDARTSVASIVDELSIKHDCATLREAIHYSINYSWITIPDVNVG